MKSGLGSVSWGSAKRCVSGQTTADVKIECVLRNPVISLEILSALPGDLVTPTAGPRTSLAILANKT
eukprot:g10014.t1